MLNKKADAAARAYARGCISPADVATARVTGGKIKPGSFRAMPILAWVRPYQGLPCLQIASILMKVAEDTHLGTLGWSVPLNDRTIVTAARLLATFGWDGRLWPGDEGWPDTVPEEAKGLEILLQGGYIGATLTFPPNPVTGSRVLRVEVLKSSEYFTLSPLVPEGEAVEPTEAQLSRLRDFMNDSAVFNP